MKGKNMIPRIKKVLYTTDLSKNSAYVFRYAINTIQKHDAQIHLIHVIEDLPYAAEMALMMKVEPKKIDQWRKDLEETRRSQLCDRIKQFTEKELKDDPVTMERIIGIHVVHGDPAATILTKIDELDCDIVIMGTHGKGNIAHTFLGRVSERVLRRIRKPVYLIPLPEKDLDITFSEM
jgi:nucleotide-binding universal stress UspA family protein